ncbi:MAG: aldehyde dehydrogenase EutE [Deltaproteobacteria bacterium]|nr:aldehyde dehydrogenase EutE [Deltaproteobacteria bacterium]
MANGSIRDDQISYVIDRVIERLQTSRDPVSLPEQSTSAPEVWKKYQSQVGLFEDMDQAIEAAKSAQLALEALSLEKRKVLIAAIRTACRSNVELISRQAVEETGMGRIEDKVQKNLLVIDKTPGVEDIEPLVFTGDYGLSLIERAPYGVMGAITPCTNPTETIICNSIGMIAAGNTVVFNPHPYAKKVCATIVDIINRASVEAGGPHTLLTCMVDPTIESAQKLMRHPKIKLLVVTGGPQVVKEAMNSGKKVIAAGPGNPPVVVDETADLSQAARDIVRGASLDNNIVCIAEKEIICVESVADVLKEFLKKNKAFEVNPHQLKQLEQVILKDGYPHKKWIGKNANVILREIGVTAGDDLRLIFAETPRGHPFVLRELLMPVIPLVRVQQVEEAIALAKEVEHGYGHTAVMHSKNIDHLHKMARALRTAIFVKNGPSFAGLGLEGEGPTSFTIASPTGEGLTSAKHFTKELRCVLKDRFRII